MRDADARKFSARRSRASERDRVIAVRVRLSATEHRKFRELQFAVFDHEKDADLRGQSASAFVTGIVKRFISGRHG